MADHYRAEAVTPEEETRREGETITGDPPRGRRQLPIRATADGRFAVFPLLAVASMCTGIALAVVMLVGGPLPVVLALLVALAALVVCNRWRSSGSLARMFLGRQVATGLLAGIAATAAYDAVRLLLYAVGGLSFFPLEALQAFGRLLLGAAASTQAAWVVGGAYHALNGVTFGVAYALLVGGRHWVAGIAWGLALEVAMVSLYPSWMDLDAVLAEFLGLSLAGHVAYGAVLGVTCQQRLAGPMPPGVGVAAREPE